MSAATYLILVPSSAGGLVETGPFTRVRFVGVAGYVNDDVSSCLYLSIMDFQWHVTDGGPLGHSELTGTSWPSIILGQAKLTTSDAEARAASLAASFDVTG